MIMEQWLVVANLCAALTSGVFVLLYLTVAGWWRSHMGRSIMSLSAAVLLLACVGLVRRWDELNPHVETWQYLRPLSAFGWTVVTLVFIYRIWAVFVLNKAKNDDDTAAGR